MSVLSAEMEFEVGDFVYFKHADNNSVSHPRKYIVAERFVQECHGGIQKSYRLVGDGVSYERLYPEIVIQKKRPPYDLRPLIEKRANEKVAWEQAVNRPAEAE